MLPATSDEYTNRLGNSVQDDREFWGNWNYWAEFAANGGAVVYALRMEITNTSAAHEVTGWNDYEFLYGSADEPANDAISNNGR